MLLGYRGYLSIIFQSSKRGNVNQYRGKEETEIFKGWNRLWKVSEELLPISSSKVYHLKPHDVGFNLYCLIKGILCQLLFLRCINLQ